MGSSAMGLMKAATQATAAKSPFLQAFQASMGTGADAPVAQTAGVVQGASPLPLQPQEPPAVTQPSGPGDLTPMITKYAQKWGINPNTALRVAKSEGGTSGWIQSKVRGKNGRREPSFGPFQMLVGGGDTGFPEGMGNQFMRETGLDVRDPRNAEAAIDFAMREASRKGWGQWYGAAKVGIGRFDGIKGNPSPNATLIANTAGAPPQTVRTGGPPSNDTTTQVRGPEDYIASFKRKMFGGDEMVPGQAEVAQGEALASVGLTGGSQGSMGLQAGSGEATSPQGAVDLGENEVAAISNNLLQKSAQGAQSPKAASRKEQLRKAMRGQA